MLPYLKVEVQKGPRPGFLYWGDEGDLLALRYGNWKVHFAEMRVLGAVAWQEPFVNLKAPKLMNLRSDPFEEADVSSFYYWDWRGERLFALAPAATLVGQYIQTLAEFPPRQSPASWSPEEMLRKLRQNEQAIRDGASPG